MASKKTKYYVQVVLLLFLLLGREKVVLHAQELPTVALESVEIVSPRISIYAIGSRTVSLDSSILNLEALPNLASIIGSYTSIAIKSYGNGMLSTISFRGTGPSHTAVLWHGVNISYPMLGQSDLSLLSMALSDGVKFQHGTSSTLYGSGALGGTVSLTSQKPMPGTSISVSQWVGSFGSLKNKVTAGYASRNFYFKVNTLWDQADNNFKFDNTTKPGIPKETQEGAEYKILGASFDSGVKLNSVGQLSLSGQYLYTNRNLQPSMNANVSGDVQTDENIRLRAQYQQESSNLPWKVSYAFLKDAISYNGSETVSDQHIIQAGVSKNIIPILKMSLSADYNMISIASPFYSAEKTGENRTNVMASFLLNPLEPLFVSLSLRQFFNTDYTIPFTPSLGVEYVIPNKRGTLLKLKTLLSRGFRVPTLNERYWQPGGNLNLVPEDSYSAEIGFESSSEKNINLSYEVTAYRMWVENWILWRPQGSFWSPENIKYVDAYGIEASGKISHSLGSIHLDWIGNYAYTKSINRTGIDQFDRSVNKQLTYVPIHQASLSSLIGLRSWSGLINASFTGIRFTTADNENQLPVYTLVNFRISKHFEKDAWHITGHANINNVLNTQYQSIENRAMPGANFLVGVTLSYYKPNQ